MSTPGDLGPLRGQPWFHTIDLPDGTCTPGVFDMRASSARLDWPVVKGARCLDVGTCDGFWAFEMERRGAGEVVAIDVDDPARLDFPREYLAHHGGIAQKAAAMRKHRFGLAAAALGSSVHRRDCSVYELDPAIHGCFDVVFSGTLLIHLRDPVRALERIASVCRGELLLVETVDARLDLIGGGRPRARFEPAPLQWWRANTAALLAMLRVAGFEVLSRSAPFATPMGAPGRSSLRSRLASPRIALAVRLHGLAFGGYDLAIRARPRPPVTSAPA